MTSLGLLSRNGLGKTKGGIFINKSAYGSHWTAGTLSQGGTASVHLLEQTSPAPYQWSNDRRSGRLGELQVKIHECNFYN